MPNVEILHTLSDGLADRYRLEREIASGGMARVFLAQDLQHGHRVAIKVLKPELTALLGPQRFLNEIQVTRQLVHPYILPIYDSGSASGILYYVMPYLEEDTLRARLETLGHPGRNVEQLEEAFAGSGRVVNCAGLGARELCGDDQLVPVRGQVVKVSPVDLPFAFADDTDPARPVYVLPRERDVVLGGTAGMGDERHAPDPGESERIRAACESCAREAADLLDSGGS